MAQWWMEWSTYTLADLLMFSPGTYYRLFELYNAAIWPGPLIAAAAGIVLLACALRPGTASPRVLAGMLAACWLWVAWAFLARRYAPINLAADYFAHGFAIEALLLFWMGTVRGKFALHWPRAIVERAGLGIFGFALFAYPLLAPVSDRPWRQMEMFGLAPDPTAVATLGLLLLARRTPWLLWPIPLLWCVLSGATLFTLGAPDAWVAPAAALLALLLVAWKDATAGPASAR